MSLRLSLRVSSIPLAAVLLACALLGNAASAQETARMSLVHREGMFTLMAAVNACGYDQDLSQSMPVREAIRTEVQRAATTPEAQESLLKICKFYNDHNQGDPSRNIAQYVSLGLSLGDAPAFELKGKEADLAPDANYVLGIVPLLQTFYINTEMHKIYAKHQPEYDRAVAKLHEPINNLLLSTDLYLRRTMSSYLGHSFTVIVEPQIAPSQVNSRNYADDYYVVLSPDSKGEVNVDQARHTYLHYILDPMMAKRANELQRYLPILNAVAAAPLDEAYRTDMSLLTTESLIKAIEARQIGDRKGPEAPRLAAVDNAMKEGFALTHYFYESLIAFEKGDVGFQQGFADWLHFLDVNRELKRIREVQFNTTGEHEVVARNRKPVSLTELAERSLAANNPGAAVTFAKQAVTHKQDVGHAYFILARSSIALGKPEDATEYFQQTLENSKDPLEMAWSHIYLGRLLDLREDREEAVTHYKAALAVENAPAEAKAAAQTGIEKPYEPQRKKDSN